MKEKPLIIEITSPVASKKDMVEAVKSQTGDEDPYFCPNINEGEPYNGHVHTFPPAGATNASSEPIKLK